MRGLDSINEPGQRLTMLTPFSHNEPPDLPDLPTLEGLNPAEAVAGETLVVVVHGTNFTPECVILLDGVAVPTNYEKDTKLNFEGSLTEVGVLSATVKLGSYETAALPFTVTAADPDDLEDEIEAAEEDGDFKPMHRTPRRKAKR